MTTTKPPSRPAPRASTLGTLALVVLIATICAVSYFVGRTSVPPAPPKVVTTEREAPSVVVAIQRLARLQSIAFHMERVVDLTKTEQALWGLVQTEDNILLIAAGDVEAGVDLGKLKPEDVQVDPVAKTVRVVLPPPEVFASRLDNQRTYVHSRRTGILGKPDAQLETEARKRAEQEIHDAALKAGILTQARASAATTVRALAASFGYAIVIVDEQGE